MEEKKDTHTTDYSAIPAISATTERIAEATDWESLEQIWEDLPKSTKAPEWKNFWKSLDDWAHDNINQGALPKVEWNRMQVAAWARKVLEFSEQSAKILIEKGIDGAVLLLVENSEKLESFGILYGSARKLWAEIEKMKKSLAEPDSKKRKITQLDGDQSEGDRKAKKQKIGAEEPLKARDIFKVAAESIPAWTVNDKNDLVARLQRVTELNDLGQQQNIYGTALQTTLPLAPYNEGRTVFQWFLHNVLPEEFQRFENQVIYKAGENVQDPNCWLVYQVSGAGKTKLAYELSTHNYTVVVRCIEDAIVPQLRKTIFAKKIGHYNRLDFENRKQLPYYSLYIVYAWIRAHLKFLELYQEVVTQFILTETQRQMYFHLIQRNGSPSSKFISHEFFSQVHSITHDEDTSLTIKEKFELLCDEIMELILKTKVKAISFDELLATQDIGVAMFAHNSMLMQNSIEDVAASQQLELLKDLQGANIMQLPEGCQAQIFTRPTSLVNGVMHFISSFTINVPFIITDTSKSVQDYFMNYTGSRVTTKIREFIPRAYLGPKDLYNLLAHYFRVPNTPALLRALNEFQGRALFFIYHFFFNSLLPRLEGKKPSSGEQVAEIIFELLRTGVAQEGCRQHAQEIVKHFYRKMGQSKDVIRAVEVSVSLCAGSMNRKRIEVTKQINQILAFVSDDKCFITEPFILEALSHRNTKDITEPNDDTIFQIYKELFDTYSGPKEGKIIGKGDVLEVLVARCFQRLQGARFDAAFAEAMKFSGILPEQNIDTLSIDCRLAGTTAQLQQSLPLPHESDLPGWSTSNAFLFPSTLMKPDGITFLIDIAESSKVLCLFQMRYYEAELSPSQVIKAVQTLDPNNFYNKKKQNDIKLRQIWLQKLNSDEGLRSLFGRYVRVVVSSAGFSEESIALVRAYNSLPTSTKTPIILFVPTEKIFGTALYAALGLNAKSYDFGDLKTIDKNDPRLAQLSVLLPQAKHEPIIEPVSASTQRLITDTFKKVYTYSE